MGTKKPFRSDSGTFGMVQALVGAVMAMAASRFEPEEFLRILGTLQEVTDDAAEAAKTQTEKDELKATATILQAVRQAFEDQNASPPPMQ